MTRSDDASAPADDDDEDRGWGDAVVDIVIEVLGLVGRLLDLF